MDRNPRCVENSHSALVVKRWPSKKTVILVADVSGIYGSMARVGVLPRPLFVELVCRLNLRAVAPVIRT
jgi:hypothetical protein